MSNRILYSQCIQIYDIDESFVDSLNESGLIQTIMDNQQKFIEYESLSDLEQFVRWYYDLNINIEGIEALYHMLSRMKVLQNEIAELKQEVHLLRTSPFEFEDI